ncbi:MAG TPA: serine/threonine-protein kinase [Phycisphaerae bacterium]|jgi:serine/threonine protein kinase/uncharacterized protein HemY
MKTDQWDKVEPLFHAALEQPTAERGQWLAGATDDASVARQVQRLLNEHETAGSFMEAEVHGAPEVSRAAEMEGTRIGAYQIVRVIGHGGMGTVYEAVQENPRRTVAVKVMRMELGAPSALRRFQYESEVLGRLLHPAIAQIYEAGTHREGALMIPFFAMEFVPAARTLTAFAQAEQLSIRQRLEIFVKVCDAVYHGHQKGIIHRDLKPANILVDASGQPKIIDFGVARVMQPDVAVTLAHSGARELVGTLQYMSPEQCDFDPAALDTRSDVYALGVVLFELLCGKLPYDVSKTSLSHAAQTIREAAPRRLSATDRRLRGDLETIVLKALEKERERRYQSAADLARDVERYLHNQPIEARPASPAYQLRKLVSRHKPLFAALAAMFISITVLAATMTVLYGRAELNRRRAEAAEAAKRDEAEKANQALNYLVGLFSSLEPAAPAEAVEPLGSTFTARELLDREARTIPQKFKGLPLVQATLLSTLGSVYGRLELFERATAALRSALELRRAALGPRHPVVSDSLCELGRALQHKGEYAEAERLYRQALDIRHQAGEPYATAGVAAATGLLADTLRARGDLESAERLFREAIRMQSGDEDDPRNLYMMVGLCFTLRMEGRWAEAEQLSRRALAIVQRQSGDRSAAATDALLNLGRVLRDAGAYADAELLAREALTIRRELLGEDHPYTARCLVDLAGIRSVRGNQDEAETLYRQVLAIFRTRVGDDHALVFATLQSLAELLVARQDRAGVDALYAEALALQQRIKGLPEDNLQHSGCLLLTGVLLVGRDDPAAAEPLLRECIERRRRVLSPDHWLTAYAENMLGGCLTALQHFDEAEALLIRSYPRVRDTIGRHDERALRALQRIIDLYDAWGRPADAERYRALLPRTD